MRRRPRVTVAFAVPFTLRSVATRAIGWAMVLVAGSASAADFDLLSPRKIGLSPVSTDWTGLYIGGEGGTGWGTSQLFFAGPMTRTPAFDTNGSVAGGAVGWNVQLPAGDWVFGVETNIDWADVRGSASCPNLAFSCGSKLTDLVSGTGRIGYAWGSALFYVKGGFAAIREEVYGALLSTGAVAASGFATRSGYTFGTGVEYMFAPNWAAKAEYDYYSFDSKQVGLLSPSGVGQGDIELGSRSITTVKAGINYHFNWHPPFAIARY